MAVKLQFRALLCAQRHEHLFPQAPLTRLVAIDWLVRDTLDWLTLWHNLSLEFGGLPIKGIGLQHRA